MSSRYVDDRNYRSSDTRRRGDRDRDPHPHTRERVESTRETTRRVIDDRSRIIDDRGPTSRRGAPDTQMPDAMDIAVDRRIDSRLDPGMDPRMDIGRDPTRANTASRIDPLRPDRVHDSRSAELQEKYVQDPTTGQLYRQVPARSAYARGADDRDYPDPVPSSRSRTAVDTIMRDDRGRDEPRATLSEYWCMGEGIEREVLQHEICKFLGQDATCRPGENRVGLRDCPG